MRRPRAVPDAGVDQPDVLVRFAARILLAPGLVVAFSLMVKAYSEVGDGFAAGVIVGLLVALHFLALGGAGAERALPILRFAPQVAIGGLLIGLAVGFFPLLIGEPVFSHRPGPGESVTTVGTLELFTPFLFDVGIFLLVVGTLTTLLHQFSRVDEVLPQDEALPADEVRASRHEAEGARPLPPGEGRS